MKLEHWKRIKSKRAFYDLDRCIACGKELGEDHKRLARREVHAVACSVGCAHDSYLAHFACCHKAKAINCVCVCATECPEHGIRHCGSHD